MLNIQKNTSNIREGSKFYTKLKELNKNICTNTHKILENKINIELLKKLQNNEKINIEEKIEIFESGLYLKNKEEFYKFYKKITRYITREIDRLLKINNPTNINKMFLLLNIIKNSIPKYITDKGLLIQNFNKINIYLNRLEGNKDTIKTYTTEITNQEKVEKLYKKFKKNTKIHTDNEKFELLNSGLLNQDNLEIFFNRYLKDFKRKLRGNIKKENIIPFYEKCLEYYKKIENNYYIEIETILNILNGEIHDINKVYNDFKNGRGIKDDKEKILLLKSKKLKKEELNIFFGKYKRYFKQKTKFLIKTSITLGLELYFSFLDEYKRLDPQDKGDIKILQEQIDFLIKFKNTQKKKKINTKKIKSKRNIKKEKTKIEKVIKKGVEISNTQKIYNFLNNKRLYKKGVDELKKILSLSEIEKQNIIYKLKTKDLIYFYKKSLLKTDEIKTLKIFFNTLYEKNGIEDDFKKEFIKIGIKLLKKCEKKDYQLISEKISKIKNR